MYRRCLAAMIGLQPLYVIISGETENVGDENTAQGRMGEKCGKSDVWLKRCLFSYINKKCFVPHMRKRLSIQGADYTKRHKSYNFSVSSRHSTGTRVLVASFKIYA